ncbi:MAG: tetratricopeptide repeat protein [Thiohalomonadales bacterium]
MPIFYATNSNIKQIKMKKTGLFFIICLLLQFTLNNPGFSANKNTTTKFNTTLKQAKEGNPKAMFLVARMLEYGKGTKKNINEASKWYQRSASQNYAAANARLGKLYLEGIGVKKNTKKAFNLLNLAAIQGIPVAQFNLAIIYELGVGTTRDLQEAIKWYELAAKGGYYAAKSKSNMLKNQLGIKSTSTTVIESSTLSEDANTEPDFAFQQDSNQIETTVPGDDLDPVESDEDITNEDEPSIDPEINSQISKTENIEEQALLGNTFDRGELDPKNAPIKVIKLNKKQKFDLINNQHIKRTLQTLLNGRWFDKNRPVNYLPSPKAQCNVINQLEIKCSSRQLQRHTDKETVFYKTLSKISKLTSSGSFLIQYQNTVVRVVTDKVVTEDGVLYQSNIKKGLQQKIHYLNCQYKDIRNLICVKDNSVKYNLKNRAK